MLVGLLSLVARAPLRAPPVLLAEPTAFASTPGWPPLQKALDALPVFTVANEEGKPLQYEVNGEKVAVFYADVAQAKGELEEAPEEFAALREQVGALKEIATREVDTAEVLAALESGR